MTRKRLALLAGVFATVASCTGMQKPIVDNRPLQAPVTVEPFLEYDIALLNPRETSDQSFLNETLRAAGVDTPTVRFNWLPVSDGAGILAYSDVAGEAEDAEQRRRMRACIGYRDSVLVADAPGVIVLTILVDGGGDVLEAGVNESTVTMPGLLACVMENVMGWEFEPGSSEQRFDVPIAIIPVRQPFAQREVGVR